MTRADLHLMVVRANRCFIMASVVLAVCTFVAIAIWYNSATLWLRLSASISIELAGVVWGTLIIKSDWDRPKRQVSIYFQEE